MDDFRPPLRFERTVAGERLVLPRRRARKTLGALAFTTVLGAFFVGVPGWAMGWPALQELASDAPLATKGARALLVLFTLPFVLIGLGVGAGPWIILLSRTKLYLEQDELRVFRGIGPLGFSRRRTTRGITGLEIEVGTSRTNGGPRKPMNNFATLVANYGDEAKPFHVAVGYPREFLRDLADLLRDKLQPRGWTTAEPTLTITESLSDDEDDADDPRHGYPATPDGVDGEPIPPQPAKSTITVETIGHRIAYRVPPRGLLRGSHGMWFFALFWNGITWLFVFAALFGDIETDSGAPPPWYFLYPFLALFVAIGAALAYQAIRMGTRRVLLEVDRVSDPPALRLTDRNWVRRTAFDFRPGDVTAVRVANSGMSSNDTPVKHLKIHLSERAADPLPRRFRKSRELGLFVERKQDELRWLAARLRYDLRVPRNPPREDG